MISITDDKWIIYVYLYFQKLSKKESNRIKICITTIEQSDSYTYMYICMLINRYHPENVTARDKII